MTQINDIPQVRPVRKTFFGVRVSALAEILLAIGALLLLDFILLERNNYWGTNPSPYLFVVLFIACKYGTKEALIATFAVTTALLSHNTPVQTLTQDAYDYLFALLRVPLLCLVSSVIFGELRQLHITERNRLEHDLEASLERERYIGESYERVKDIKQRLEVQVAGQMRSAIAVYNAAKNLESLTAIEIMQGIEELVKTTLNPDKFSLYTMHKTGLHHMLANGWSEEDKYARNFDTSSMLYHAVVTRKSIVCIVSSDQEKILNGQGIIAGPLIDRATGEVFGMLKIEAMHFVALHLTNIQTFSAICDWAGMALLNARKYQLSKASSIVNPDHSLFTKNYFHRYADYITSLARRINFDVTMVTITLDNPLHFDKDMRTRIAKVLADSVSKVLRNVDMAFENEGENGDYSIILPTTNSHGAQVVIDKIRAAFMDELMIITETARFTFSFQVMYEKNSA